MSIALKNIYAGYHNKPVLTDFSIALPRAGVYALSGPSGCGKTTLLRVLAGLLLPASGEIAGLKEKRISFVFQEDRLLPWRTAEENVLLALPDRVAHPRTIAAHWLSCMELSDAKKMYPGALSGGMQRRVAIARACAYGGDVLLLDEPFQGLDEALRARIAPYILAAAPLIVLVTHDAEDAQLFGATVLTPFA